MAGASRFVSCGFRNPVQKYSKKKRPTKMGLIFGNFRKTFRKEWRYMAIFPRTLSETF